MAVLVWKDTMLYQKYVGEDFNVNTQLPAGCMSAWFTAALTMTFVDQGKLSLDDPVSKYLPIFSKYAKKYLTVRHCLANITGLEPEKGGIEKFFQKTKFEMLEDQVNAFASGREILNNPGEVFMYNNMGTNIVGRVLEVVGKRGFDRLMVERIFRPLGMKKSSFSSDRAVNPFSGAVTTASDYMRFMMMLLNKGTLGTKRVLSEKSVDELFRVQTGNAKIGFVPPGVTGYSYGLGNWLQNGNAPGICTSPALTGGWPWIDRSKGYAAIVFGQQKDKEDRKDVYIDFIREVDAAVGVR